MNQSFFIGAVGAHQQQQSLNVVSNNIANINTQGFKASKARFTALMYDNLRAIEQETVEFGVGGAIWTTDTDHSTGGGIETGRKQDYMIDGSGFFALRDLNTGEVTYTRNGAFQWCSLQRNTGEVDEAGVPIMEQVFYLSDSVGRVVLDQNKQMIELGVDGDRDAKQPVGLFDFVNYNGMGHENNTRFMNIPKNGQEIPGGGDILQGMLEGSNADLATEMVDVIEAQRAYSMALKMMTTSDEIESTINNLRG